MSGMPTIGDVVREWRRYRQISLTEFSKRTKRSKGYISELEHNKIDNPKPDKLERMAAALGISVVDIVSRRMPEDGQALGQVPQSISTPLPTIAHPAMAIPGVQFGATGKEVERLIASARLSEEEEERVSVEVIEFTKRLLGLVEALRNSEKI